MRTPGGEGSHSPEGHEAEAPRRPPPSMAHSRRVPEDPSSHTPRPRPLVGPPRGHSQAPDLPSGDSPDLAGPLQPGTAHGDPSCWSEDGGPGTAAAGLGSGAWGAGARAGPGGPHLPPVLWEPPPGARAVREPGEPDARGEGSEGASGGTPSVGLWLLQEEGYCQGTSEIAAIVLMFLPEEDASWVLAQLMTDDRHAMHGFFVPGFQKLLRFQAHHERVLERALPDLRKHMASGSSGGSVPGARGRRWGARSSELPRVGVTFLPLGPGATLGAGLGRGERVHPAPGAAAWGLRPPALPPGRGADVHRHLHPEVVPAVLPRPDPLLAHPEALGCVYTGWGAGAHGHRKRLLKLPLEGLREFLQDSLAQPWALEDEAVLRRLRASMTQLRRMRCDLPPQDLRSSPRGPWAWSKCPRCPGLSSLLRPLRHPPGWRSRPPRAQPPSLSRPDPLPARPSSNIPPSDGTPSPSSQCNKTVQAGGPQTWWA
uniref:Rab-GAP TBC domain-containing protein n=1 Tax=Canis lupus familiaris TaxID=9615 RepID=A0A8I3S2Q2_CANLF